jgi:Protein of unknown function (DUF3617)
VHGRQVARVAVRRYSFLAAFLAATAAVPSFAADDAIQALNARLKPGLYETITESQTEMPGVPMAQDGKLVQKGSECITARDLEISLLGHDDGMADPQCPVSKYEFAGDRASFTIACGGDSTTNYRVAFVPGGYDLDVDARARAVQGFPGLNIKMKKQARYAGPCK